MTLGAQELILEKSSKKNSEIDWNYHFHPGLYGVFLRSNPEPLAAGCRLMASAVHSSSRILEDPDLRVGLDCNSNPLLVPRRISRGSTRSYSGAQAKAIIVFLFL